MTAKKLEKEHDGHSGSFKAAFLIVELIELNPDIEAGEFMTAMQGICANMLFNADAKYEYFCKVLDVVKKHYKYLWDGNDGKME